MLRILYNMWRLPGSLSTIIQTKESEHLKMGEKKFYMLKDKRKRKRKIELQNWSRKISEKLTFEL